MRGGSLSPVRAALSVAIGLAIGVTPLYGFHLLIVLAICLPLRLDAAVSYIAANISLPFIAPFIVFAEIEMGARLLTGEWLALSLDEIGRHGAARFGRELLWGTFALAPLLAVVGGGLTYVGVRAFRKPAESD